MAFFTFSDPVESLLRLQRELDQFIHRTPATDSFAPTGVFPAINVFTDRDGLVVRAEVPGVNAESLTVDVERRTLTITGERQGNDVKGSHHRRERQVGRFSRALHLPDDLDTEAASAACKDGVLTVRIPKRQEAKPRQITVKAA
jgi:HSP20 family protein